MRLPIRWKLLLVIALPILVVFVAMIAGILPSLQRVARRSVEQRMTETAERYAESLDASLRELAQVARSNALAMELAEAREADLIYARLGAEVARNAACYGAAIAFEPDGEAGLFGPYVHRTDDGLRRLDVAADAYDYTDPQWEWYDGPRRTGSAGWTAPYFDEGAGGTLMSTFSSPFSRDGAFAGVATVDIALEQLRRTVETGFPRDLDVFVVTSEGQFVFHPDAEHIMHTSVFEVAETENRPDLQALAEAMTRMESGTRAIETAEGRKWVFFAPVESAGWSIAAAVFERDALAPVRSQIAWLAGVLGGTLVLIVLLVWFISDRIGRPIAHLTRAVREVSAGNLDAKAPDEERQDELGELARSFNKMRGDIDRIMQERADEQAHGRDAIIFSLARLAESRDNETGQHLERICCYVEMLAEELARDRDDIDEHWVKTIAVTAALHDIGKVGVPDAVLLKPGRLTDEERQIIQTHTTIGGDTLLAIKRRWDDDTFLRTATEIAFAHHERWDGKGYPFGLAKEDIALSARIVSVADVYDALTSKRVYKPGMSHEEASRIIIEGSGTQFDPEIVAIFERIGPRMAKVAQELHDDGS